MIGAAMDWSEQDLRRRLSNFERRAQAVGDRRPAAVVLAVVGRGEEAVLLTRRGSLKRHRGQYALPGGAVDPGETVEAAALREMHEEVGLEVGPERIWGLLDDYPTRSGWVITPVVVDARDAGEPVPDPGEVAEVYRIPFAELARPEAPVTFDIPESDRPVLAMEVIGDLVFAPTAAVLYQFREVALAGRDTRVAHFEQPVFAWR